MSTDTEGVESLACNSCGTTVPKPAPVEYAPLWDAGWRWTGDPSERPLRFAPHAKVYSCPACPPVI